MTKLNVVFITDEKYLQHFIVACTSLMENSHRSVGRIFLVHDLINGSKLNRLIKWFYNKYNLKIEDIFLDSTIFNSYKVGYHFSKATYYRLCLAEILPRDIDCVLYLDVDLIVVKDLSPLLDYDFTTEQYHYEKDDNESPEEYDIFAVDHELRIFEQEQFNNIDRKYISKDKYFNTGVMLINLKKWREQNNTKYLLEIADKYHSHTKWLDQDILNIAFNARWGELPYAYNSFKPKDSSDTNELFIIHYIGSSKPWHYMNNHPHKYLYWQYIKKTLYKYYCPKDLTFKNLMRKTMPPKVKRYIKKLVI